MVDNTRNKFLEEYTLAEGIHINSRGAFVYTSKNSKLNNKEELKAICTEYNRLLKEVKE